jgi:UDP-glucose 4-epimerase
VNYRNDKRKKMHNTRVLVTGGAGFIGSHLVDRLIENGYNVTVLDNYFSGNKKNLQFHLSNKKLELIKADVRDSKTVRKAVKGASTVFHLAAIVDVPLSIKEPKLTNDVNVNGTLSVLKASLTENVKNFIYTSTCAVYGEAGYLPINEEHPTMPLSPYGTSKLVAENHCRNYSSQGLKTCCLRLFNVYGSRQQLEPYSGVITKFIQKIEENTSLVIFGDGKQTRDFIFVEDIVNACMLAMRYMYKDAETYNIGTGKPTSINELANTLIKLLGKTGIKKIHKPPKKGDIKNSYANVSKARRMIKFEPKVKLKDGVKSLLETE